MSDYLVLSLIYLVFGILFFSYKKNDPMYIIVFILASMIITFGIIIFKKRQKEKIEYELGVLLNDIKINVSKKQFYENFLVINEPYWKYENKDGSPDRRRKNNQLIEDYSYLYIVRPNCTYILSSKNARDIEYLANELRINSNQDYRTEKKNIHKSSSNEIHSVSAEEFMEKWIIKDGNRKHGYKYSDMSGCYMIKIFENPIFDDVFDSMDFSNIYIGQSKNIYKRVYNHLTGKGNGDVYADFKFGKNVYITFIPTAIDNMNFLEKHLIETYDAVKSYNKTKGGS